MPFSVFRESPLCSYSALIGSKLGEKQEALCISPSGKPQSGKKNKQYFFGTRFTLLLPGAGNHTGNMGCHL